MQLMDSAENSIEPTRVVGRPFKPGQSGNPGGRPAVSHPATMLRELTDDGAEVMDFVLSVFRGTAGKLWLYLKYRIWAIEWISDRLWGKPVQAIQSQGLSLIEIRVLGPDDQTSNTPTSQLDSKPDTHTLDLPISTIPSDSPDDITF